MGSGGGISLPQHDLAAGLRQDGPVWSRAGRASEAKAKPMDWACVAVELTGTTDRRCTLYLHTERTEKRGRGYQEIRASLGFGSVRLSPRVTRKREFEDAGMWVWCESEEGMDEFTRYTTAIVHDSDNSNETVEHDGRRRHELHPWRAPAPYLTAASIMADGQARRQAGRHRQARTGCMLHCAYSVHPGGLLISLQPSTAKLHKLPKLEQTTIVARAVQCIAPRQCPLPTAPTASTDHTLFLATRAGQLPSELPRFPGTSLPTPSLPI